MIIHPHCLCGSGIDYHQCCEPFHSGEKIPATAEALMRSRYTAYAMHNASYLQETWDFNKRPEKIDFSRENIDWLRLEITDTKKGGIKDSKGMVSFKAFYMQDGEEHVMNEISRFTRKRGATKEERGGAENNGRAARRGRTSAENEERREKLNGRWFYLDGVIKSIGKVGLQTNQGKNALCSCGSGKKFKRCCVAL